MFLKKLEKIEPDVSRIALIALVLSALIAILVKKGPGPNDTIKTLFGATTFLFGIFLTGTDAKNEYKKQ